MHLEPLERLIDEFRREADQIYFPETADEYIFVYMSDIVEFLRSRRDRALAMRSRRTFLKRPFIARREREL